MLKAAALIFVLFCATLVGGSPLESHSREWPALTRITRENPLGSRRTLFDFDEKDFDEGTDLLAFTDKLDKDNIKRFRSNGPSFLSGADGGKKHFFTTFASGSKDHVGSKDNWLGVGGTYFHKPSESKLFAKANRTKSGLGIKAGVFLNLNKDHKLFSDFDLENQPESLSGIGLLGYSHESSGSEVVLKANRDPLRTALTLTGKTDLLSNDENSFRSLFSASRNLERGNDSVAANFDYIHKNSGSGLTLGTEYSNDELSLNGTANWKINDKHALSSFLNGKHAGGQWSGSGHFDYHHKPSNSSLGLGFGPDVNGRKFFLNGGTNFGSKNKHGLKATGFANQGLDGVNNYGGLLGYHHKPSNSVVELGVQGNQGQPQLMANGNFNFKNGAKLNFGGHYSNEEGFSGGSFQLSGAFK